MLCKFLAVPGLMQIFPLRNWCETLRFSKSTKARRRFNVWSSAVNCSPVLSRRLKQQKSEKWKRVNSCEIIDALMLTTHLINNSISIFHFQCFFLFVHFPSFFNQPSVDRLTLFPVDQLVTVTITQAHTHIGFIRCSFSLLTWCYLVHFTHTLKLYLYFLKIA